MKLQGHAPSEKLHKITKDLNEASEEMMEASWRLLALGDELSEIEIKADRAKAKAFTVSSVVTAKSQEMRETLAGPHWESEREAYLKAKYSREALYEVVRCYRQRVSALQTTYNREKTELEALQYGQDGGA